MKKNTAVDLHDHLMARIERLADEDLSGEDLEAEIRRSEATVKVAGSVIENARLVLAAERHFAEYDIKPSRETLPMLTTKKEE